MSASTTTVRAKRAQRQSSVPVENADNHASPPKRTYPAESQAPENDSVEDAVARAGEAELDAAVAGEQVVEDAAPDRDDNRAFFRVLLLVWIDTFFF